MYYIIGYTYMFHIPVCYVYNERITVKSKEKTTTRLLHVGGYRTQWSLPAGSSHRGGPGSAGGTRASCPQLAEKCKQLPAVLMNGCRHPGGRAMDLYTRIHFILCRSMARVDTSSVQTQHCRAARP